VKPGREDRPFTAYFVSGSSNTSFLTGSKNMDSDRKRNLREAGSALVCTSAVLASVLLALAVDFPAVPDGSKLIQNLRQSEWAAAAPQATPTPISEDAMEPTPDPRPVKEIPGMLLTPCAGPMCDAGQ